jgi:hypothetical protein
MKLATSHAGVAATSGTIKSRIEDTRAACGIQYSKKKRMQQSQPDPGAASNKVHC